MTHRPVPPKKRDYVHATRTTRKFVGVDLASGKDKTVAVVSNISSGKLVRYYDIKSVETNHQRRQAKKRFKKPPTTLREVRKGEVDRQRHRAMLTKEEKAERRAHLRKMNGQIRLSPSVRKPIPIAT